MTSIYPMVFRFGKAHELGSICGIDCEYCNDPKAILYNAFGKPVDTVPMYILAEATEEQWRSSVVANGGRGIAPSIAAFYYFVSMD